MYKGHIILRILRSGSTETEALANENVLGLQGHALIRMPAQNVMLLIIVICQSQKALEAALERARTQDYAAPIDLPLPLLSPRVLAVKRMAYEVFV